MKVRDLIEKLQQYPDDAVVVLRSRHRQDYNDFNAIKPEKVVKIKGRCFLDSPLAESKAYECNTGDESVDMISLDGGTILQRGE